MPPRKQNSAKKVPIVNTQVVEWIKKDLIELETPSLKFRYTEAHIDDQRTVDFEELNMVFTVESNDLLFKALSSKLISHWKKVIAKTLEKKLEFTSAFMAELEEMLKIIALKKFYSLFDLLLPLILELYGVGKHYYTLEDYPSAIRWLQHAIAVYRCRVVTETSIDKRKSVNLWFLYEYLANSSRKAGMYREAYNSIVEGLYRHPDNLREAVRRWSLTTKDVLESGKMPKHLTLASGFRNFLGKTPNLNSVCILECELENLEKCYESRYHAYHEAVLDQSAAEYLVTNDEARWVRVVLKKSTLLKTVHNNSRDAMRLTEEAMARLRVSEVDEGRAKVLSAQLSIQKYVLLLPCNNAEMDISRQMKELDALQNKEETTESPLDTDNQTNTCIKDDVLVTNCNLDLIISAYDLYKEALGPCKDGALYDEFDLEYLKLLAVLLQMHQHKSTAQCLLLLLKLSFCADNHAKLLWAASHFSHLLLQKQQVAAAATFVRDVEALLEGGGEGLPEREPASWLSFQLCKCEVFLRNNQLESLLSCLQRVPPAYHLIKDNTLEATYITAQLHRLLWSVVATLAVQDRAKVFEVVACVQPVAEALALLGDKHSYGTRIFWASASSSCFNSLVYSLFESKNTVLLKMSERLSLVNHLVDSNVLVGGAFVRVGVAREAQVYLIQALAYSKTFSMKYRMAECMLALVRLSSMQNFHADTNYHLNVLDRSLFPAHDRRMGDGLGAGGGGGLVGGGGGCLVGGGGSMLGAKEAINKGSSDVGGGKVDATVLKNNNNISNSSNNNKATLPHSSSQLELKTPKNKSSRSNHLMASGKVNRSECKAFRVYVDDDDDDKENAPGKVVKARGGKKGDLVDKEDDYDLGIKPLVLELNDEQGSPSRRRRSDVVVCVPACWSVVESRKGRKSDRSARRAGAGGGGGREAGSVCVECGDVLNGRRLQLLKLTTDCEVADRSGEVMVKAIEELERCREDLVQAAVKEMQEELVWEEVCALKEASVLMFDESLEGKFEGIFNAGLIFHESYVRLKLLKLQRSLKLASVQTVLSECLSEASSLARQAGMHAVAAEMASQIRLASFPIGFQWPPAMQGYLSEMTLICSAVGRLPTYHEEDESLTATAALPSILPTPARSKKATSSSFFLEPEAPLKKPRKPRMPTLELPTRLQNLSLEDSSVVASTESADLLNAMAGTRSDPCFLSYRLFCTYLALSFHDDSSTAHYLAESLSVSLRHNTLFVLTKKKRNLEKQLRGASKTSADMQQWRTNLDRMLSFVGFEWSLDTFKRSLHYLPSEWTVLLVNSVQLADRSQLVLTRLSSRYDPLVIPLPPLTTKQRQEYLERFEWVKRECRNNMKVTSKKDWWTKMGELDGQLEELLEDLEKEWLSCWRGAFLGALLNEADEESLSKEVERFFKLCPFVPRHKSPLVKQFLHGADGLDVRYILQGLHYLSSSSQQPPFSLVDLKKFVPGVQALCKRLNLAAASRGPVILVLDKDIQHLPFESLPFLKKQTFTRQLSYHSMIGHLVCSTDDSILKKGVDRSSVFYVINPDNNLPDTEERFLEWFKKSGWQGVAGEAPSAEGLSNNLCSKDLFIYTGHGSGSKYLNGGSLQMLNCRSAALLMGCSSGRLWAHGVLEPVGMLNYYFLAGSPCVLANLWEVTDKDINRYTHALLQAWMHSVPQSDEQTSLAPSISPPSFSDESLVNCVQTLDESTTSHSRPEGKQPSKLSLNKSKFVRKTAKSSEVDDKKITDKKTSKASSPARQPPPPPPPITKTQTSDDWLANSALASREVCKLKYVNGAAPVIYGFPIARKP